MALVSSKLILLFLTFLLKCQISSLYRVSERIYDKIQGDSACFKRLNGTNEFGCTSKANGNVGVVHFVENDTDIQWVIEKGPHSPYIIALTPRHFTKEVLEAFWNSGKLAGAVLINNGNAPSAFTSDRVCPNAQSSIYLNTSYSDYCEEHPWNPYGTSLLYENWDFPIFLLDQEESIQRTLDCFYDFNQPDADGNPRDWPLCSMELKSLMYATSNSEVCMRRSERTLFFVESSFCEPLEDFNVWNSLHPLNHIGGPKEDSITMVLAAADASSQFDNRSPGADVAVSGVVTLLATAEALSKQEMTNIDKNVMFVLFQGESWDYIGSSRMVYDMQKDQFPFKEVNHEDHINKVNMSHIETIIDLRQVGLSSDRLFMHSDPLSNSILSIGEKTQKLMDRLREMSDKSNVAFQEAPTGTPLPPSSMQSFLKARNISGILISDHEKEYKNMFYQSIFDDYRNVNYTSLNESDDHVDRVALNIADTASVLASSLYSLHNDDARDVKVNQSLVDNLLYCYLKNVNCSFFQQFCDEGLRKTLYKAPAKMYISVKIEENYIPLLTGRILSYLTGEVDNNYDASNCTSNSTQVFYLTYFPYIDGGICVRSTVHYTKALSPAFLQYDYDWSSGEFSSWTESTWFMTGARIFLRPSVASEIGLVLCGLLCVTASIVLVYFCNTRASILFTSDVAPSPI